MAQSEVTPTTHMAVSPPVAKREPFEATVHDDTRVDDYHWLREKESPEVIAYLKAENAYADSVTEQTKELEETLYQETVSRVKQTDLSVPYRDGEYLYYSRTEEGKQYPVHCRKKGALDATEEIFLDVNAMAEGEAFMSIGTWRVSPDGMKLAYTVDNTGFRDFTLYIKDLRTGQSAPAVAGKVKSAAWAADSRTLFYSVDDDAKRAYRIFRHVPGGVADALILEESDERFRVGVWTSRNGDWLFIESSSHTTTETRCLPAAEPQGEFWVIASRRPDIEYSVGQHGAEFYILVNDTGRNFRLVKTPTTAPGPDNWQEVIAHSDDVMLEDLDLFAGHLVLHERQGGLPHLRVMDLATGTTRRVTFPDPVYSVFADRNAVFDTTAYRFSYQSMTTPPSVFDYDMVTGKRELLKQTEVLGDYDPTRYTSERLEVVATDGARVPVSLVYRKGVKRDGKAPLYLVAYGSYGFSYPVFFDPARIGLLDRGVTYGIAHVRGGGEMGKKWHDDGRMFAKKNTFTDFISVAKWLADNAYTSSDRLAVAGGSAGGLLMGAVANMRPDLFRVVVARVPFVDVLNTMLDEDAPLTVGEFEEWGNPAIKEQYDFMKSYCPYTNIVAQDYPILLVKTSLNDSQVMYWEPAKYVAKLRAHKTDDNPLVFKTNIEGGHGGASGRYDRWREDAFDYAFVLHHLGVRD